MPSCVCCVGGNATSTTVGSYCSDDKNFYSFDANLMVMTLSSIIGEIDDIFNIFRLKKGQFHIAVVELLMNLEFRNPRRYENMYVIII